MILIDPVRLDTFLCDRSPPSRALVESPETATDDTNAPVQNHAALLDVPPMPVENPPNDAMWRGLVLVLQRELDDANKAREARLLNLLGQVTKPTPSPSRRLKVGEVALIHRIQNYLESVDRPQRVWQVQQALKLDKPPYRELSCLVARGEIQ